VEAPRFRDFPREFAATLRTRDAKGHLIESYVKKGAQEYIFKKKRRGNDGATLLPRFLLSKAIFRCRMDFFPPHMMH
jgi:hypothetical protein